MFLREYVPQSLRDAWRAEFEQLRQGSMIVSKYAIRFSDLARHTPAFVVIVRERVRRFIQGLHPGIRFNMARELEMDIAYQQIVSISRRLKGMQIRERKERGYVCRPINSTLPASNRIPATPRPQVPYYEPPVFIVPPVGGTFSGQSSRSGPNQSQQPRPPRAYFEYGDTRHIMKDYPRFRRGAPPQNSQAPSIPQGVQASQDMIIAPVATPPTQLARGGGQTGVPHDSLSSSIYISTPVSRSIIVDHVYRLCLIVISGFEIRTDLLLLSMVDFDIILGMDWLSPYHAILDCHAQMMMLVMPGLPWLEWRCTLDYVTSSVVSFLKAQRMVEKWCNVYLAYARDVIIYTPTMESVPVVRDFSDVFPADLLVLMQDDRMIAYASRQLKVHEKHYTVHDHELADIVHALKI
ncbi:uncharacterized protein [Nicotiana tomentosiformis]|uniref:uncharacterized protein n=1 Tax=Nicotiana tomentosiformis TaxID=4098 RepID=UPI00388C802B